MATNIRPIQRTDLDDPQKLFEHLVELGTCVQSLVRSNTVLMTHNAQLQRQIAGMQQAPPQTIDSVRGVAADPQHPFIPKLTSLPDPHASPYTMVKVVAPATGVVTLYSKDESKLPKKWEKVVDLP